MIFGLKALYKSLFVLPAVPPVVLLYITLLHPGGRGENPDYGIWKEWLICLVIVAICLITGFALRAIHKEFSESFLYLGEEQRKNKDEIERLQKELAKLKAEQK